MAVQKIDLTCPKCGGNMERDTEKRLLHCPYCGHEAMLQRDDTEEKAYARQRGIERAKMEAEELSKRRRRRGVLIAAAVVLAFILAAAVVSALQPKVDPFAYIDVVFSGETGDGSAEVVRKAADGKVDPELINYRVDPRSWLSEGDVITITADSSEYKLSPTKKTYKVEGLDTVLKDLSALSDKAVEMIHNKSDITAGMAVEGAGTSDAPTSVERCVMYLVTDGRSESTLYDVYKVQYPEKDEGYAERYVVVYYAGIIVRDTEEPTMSYDRTMYMGGVIETLDRTYGGYMTGYKTLKDVKADILSHQSKAVTLQEREG